LKIYDEFLTTVGKAANLEEFSNAPSVATLRDKVSCLRKQVEEDTTNIDISLQLKEVTSEIETLERKLELVKKAKEHLSTLDSVASFSTDATESESISNFKTRANNLRMSIPTIREEDFETQLSEIEGDLKKLDS